MGGNERLPAGTCSAMETGGRRGRGIGEDVGFLHVGYFLVAGSQRSGVRGYVGGMGG